MKGVGSWDEQIRYGHLKKQKKMRSYLLQSKFRESGRMFLPMSDEKIMLEKLYLIDHQHLKNAAAVFYVSRNFVIHRWLYIRMMI